MLLLATVSRQPIVPDAYVCPFYLDNILVGNTRDGFDKNRIPDVLMDNYYGENLDFSTDKSYPQIVNQKFIKRIFIAIDTTHNGSLFPKREIHTRTKKAKDGFLYVNQCIMDYVARSGCEPERVEIAYVYNNETVRTKEDVARLLRLRKKRIQVSVINQDSQTGLYTAIITDK